MVRRSFSITGKLLLTIVIAGYLTGCTVTRRSTPKPPQKSMTSEQWTFRDSPVPPQDSEYQTTGHTATESAEAIVREAHKWLGTRYSYGGHSRSGTDCSGLVMEVYLAATGLKLPRNSGAQREYCLTVKKSDLVKGDLLFFSSGANSSNISHVGLYIGNGQMIHASTSKGVIVSGLSEPYFQRRWHSGGRVPQFAKPAQKKKSKTSKRHNPASDQKQQATETPPSLDDEISSRIDSIYSSMLD